MKSLKLFVIFLSFFVMSYMYSMEYQDEGRSLVDQNVACHTYRYSAKSLLYSLPVYATGHLLLLITNSYLDDYELSYKFLTGWGAGCLGTGLGLYLGAAYKFYQANKLEGKQSIQV